MRYKPSWIGDIVEGNDGAMWAPSLLDDKNLLYSVPSPFDDDEGATCLAWLRCGCGENFADIIYGSPLPEHRAITLA